MPSELIFELGCEELPASFIVPALRALESAWREEAKRLRIRHGEAQAHGTPRRLALLVEDVADRAEDVEERGEGPALQSAFDAEGRPTKAAEGFARKWGVAIAELERENGRLVARRKVAGQPTFGLLPDLFQRLIQKASENRKLMRWGNESVGFPRPVRWIVAVFGGEVVPVEFGDVAATGLSRGHRFLSPGPVQFGGIADYLPKLREAKVLGSVAERRERIVAEIDRLAAEAGGRRVEDPELVDTLCGLVEWPTGVLGSFGADALDMPREVLVSEMRGHQKYASIESADGKLLPRFVAIANTPVKDDSVSRRGYERVLRARLADARFFFDEDRARTLASRVSDLRRVTFQEKLGSVFDKTERILHLSKEIARAIGREDLDAVERTATLCKADLTCGMVGEFPDLQGVMGREYARHDGERDEVAAGIFEHYLPRSAADGLPTGDLGAIVGIADRLDTISGIFAIGKSPTGANDPFALRRACLGIIRIVIDKEYRLSLSALLDTALEHHYHRFEKLPPPEPKKDKDGKERKPKPELLDRGEAKAQVLDFFRGRLKADWSNFRSGELKGFWPPDIVEAVLAAGFDDITDAYRRGHALNQMTQRSDFKSIAVAFARASNIITKQAKDLVPGPVDPTLFRDPPEEALQQATSAARAQVEAAVRSGDYTRALLALAELRPAVDLFFDQVLVMAEDPAIKQNRLRLVREVQQLFAPIADLARIQTK